MTSANRFGIPELSDEHVQRLLQAASMISDGDNEIEETILEGTTTNLKKLVRQSDGTEDAIETIVDTVEGLMPDLAFGDADDAIELIVAEEAEQSDELIETDFESLDALEEAERSGEKLSYEEFQEEWN